MAQPSQYHEGLFQEFEAGCDGDVRILEHQRETGKNDDEVVLTLDEPLLLMELPTTPPAILDYSPQTGYVPAGEAAGAFFPEGTVDPEYPFGLLPETQIADDDEIDEAHAEQDWSFLDLTADDIEDPDTAAGMVTEWQLPIVEEYDTDTDPMGDLLVGDEIDPAYLEETDLEIVFDESLLEDDDIDDDETILSGGVAYTAGDHVFFPSIGLMYSPTAGYEIVRLQLSGQYVIVEVSDVDGNVDKSYVDKGSELEASKAIQFVMLHLAKI